MEVWEGEVWIQGGGMDMGTWGHGGYVYDGTRAMLFVRVSLALGGVACTLLGVGILDRENIAWVYRVCLSRPARVKRRGCYEDGPGRLGPACPCPPSEPLPGGTTARSRPPHAFPSQRSSFLLGTRDQDCQWSPLKHPGRPSQKTGRGKEQREDEWIVTPVLRYIRISHKPLFSHAPEPKNEPLNNKPRPHR